MSMSDLLELSAAILASIGAGGAVVLGLSNYLGKIWAERLMAKEAAKHSRELEHLRSTLAAELSRSTENYQRKIQLYQEASNPLIGLVVKAMHRGNLERADMEAFDQQRLETTALLAMFAPAAVLNSYNDLIDFLFDAVDDEERWSFQEFRARGLKFLSLIRADIGLYADEVTYFGHR